MKKADAKKAVGIILLFALMYLAGAGIAKTIQLVQDSVVQTSSSGENWGLSFQKEGAAPVANATADELKKYDAYYINETEEKVIYLTFDAGFENGNTAPILDALKKHNAKATFFLVGNYIRTSPDLVKRMIAEGHTVGNHTENHPNMSKIATMEAFRQEIEGLEAIYKEVTGEDIVKLYRPP